MNDTILQIYNQKEHHKIEEMPLGSYLYVHAKINMSTSLFLRAEGQLIYRKHYIELSRDEAALKRGNIEAGKLFLLLPKRYPFYIKVRMMEATMFCQECSTVTNHLQPVNCYSYLCADCANV